MKKLICLSLLIAAGYGYLSAQAQKPADAIVKEACQTAGKQHKNVFIIFHASWCGWCRQMDSLMNNADCKKLFDDHYVIRHIDVQESDEKKNLENPGGEMLLKKYHGDQQGIPYWIILSPEGKLLADSRIKPPHADPSAEYPNAGCPATPEEVAYFTQVLKATSPLNGQQLAVIQRNFKQK